MDDLPDGAAGLPTSTPSPLAVVEPKGTLRIAGAGDVDSMDPAAMYSLVSWFLARGVFRTLTTYRASGPSGTDELVGDLATDTGVPNEDASEWTFTLRSGIRYGNGLGGERVPGVTGSEIVCADLKYAIERLFIPGVEAGYPFYFEIIEGVSAFRRGAADSVDGIECSDDKTIVFDLEEPAADWPHRMALPATAPVPPGFAGPLDAGGTSGYGKEVVSSGPYFVAAYEPGEEIVLERNEEWDASTDLARRARVRSVRWRLGMSSDEGIEKVMRGDFDLALDIEPHGTLLERVVTDPRLLRRLVNEPEGCTHYVFLDTRVEPFDDPLVRRAVNLAIDRASLKRIYGGPLTGPVATSVIPPGIEGHLPARAYNPFKTEAFAGDMKRARRLMERAGYGEGYGGRVALSTAASAPLDRIMESVSRDLERLGFSNIEVVHDRGSDRRSRARAAVGTSGWCKDYPRPFSFLAPVLGGGTTARRDDLDLARLHDPRLDSLIERAQGTLDPAAARRLWEKANRVATMSGAWIPWSWDETTILYGPRPSGVTYLSAISHVDWVNVRLKTRRPR